jgi:SAM-dependent methyltransferase
VPNFGIEPTKSTAEVAREIGVKTLEEFFSQELARKLSSQGDYADLIIGNNVYAHVPDINDFTLGMKELLKPNGTIVLEFPHLLNMIKENLFDTIYHEHFSYLSLHVVNKIFKAAGLRVWDVEKISTHGGSLRVYGCHFNSKKMKTGRVDDIVSEEIDAGLLNPKTYNKFEGESIKIKNNLQKLLISKHEKGQKIIAYGAAAKGNTLLNFAGVKKDLIAYVVDASIAKQGLYLPGSHIPIYAPAKLVERDFESILILPWNLHSEITTIIRKQYKINTSLFTAVPTIKFY